MKRSPVELKLIKEFETIVIKLEDDYKKPKHHGKNFYKGGANACTILRSHLERMKGEKKTVETYPKEIKKHCGLNHMVELVQYGPDAFEVQTSSLLEANNFGATGQLNFAQAELKYTEQVNLVEKGEF